jgi:hypothetical protein
MTDTVELGRRPCPCGKAEIVEYRETPDHGWSSDQWVRNYDVIECPECASTYLMHGSGFILRGDYEAREQERQAAWKQKQSFLTSPGVLQIFERLSERLDREQSVAAVYRLLNKCGLVIVSENTFRRYWSGGADWIKKNSGTHLSKKLIEIGALKPEKHGGVIDELERLAKLDEANERPLPLANFGGS